FPYHARSLKEIVLYRRPDKRRKPVHICPTTEPVHQEENAKVATPNTPSRTNGASVVANTDLTVSEMRQPSSDPSHSSTLGCCISNTMQENRDAINVNDSSPESPESARASRSMHRYESKHIRPTASTSPGVIDSSTASITVFKTIPPASVEADSQAAQTDEISNCCSQADEMKDEQCETTAK
ncbi:hypothetical protein EG68_04103, partial [Paragonimus skrjabini miyazakii]